jgi:hypothetical protein
MYLIAENDAKTSEYKVAVEFVGQEKLLKALAQLDKLTVACLSRRQISHCSSSGSELAKVCPSTCCSLSITLSLSLLLCVCVYSHIRFALSPSLFLLDVTSLDLEDNLFDNFDEIATLIEQLQLRELRLSLNRFGAPFKAQTIKTVNMEQMRVLMLNGISGGGNINNVNKAWQLCCMLGRARRLPKLEELHLCTNRIKTLPLQQSQGDDAKEVAQWFPALRLLNLSANAIATWQDVATFAACLPRLEELWLNENRLRSIELSCKSSSSSSGDSSSNNGAVRSLRRICLNDNLVMRLAHVVPAIDSLPALTQFALQRNPVEQRLHQELVDERKATCAAEDDKAASESKKPEEEEEEQDADFDAQNKPLSALAGSNLLRSIVIAQLPKLRYLNLSEVRPRERSDAEKLYVKRCFNRMRLRKKKTSSSSSSSLENKESGLLPPRQYARLVLEHGDPSIQYAAEQASALQAGKAMKDRLIVLNLVYEPDDDDDAADDATVQRQTLKMLPSTNIARVRLMCHKLFKIASRHKLSLVYYDKANPPPELSQEEDEADDDNGDDDEDGDELDDAKHSLSYYGVESDGFIVVFID